MRTLRITYTILCVCVIGFTPAASDGAPQSSAEQLFAAGDFAAAGDAYAAVLKQRPADAAAQLGLGAIRLYENDLDGADQLLGAVLAADPTNPRAERLRAEVQRRRDDLAQLGSVVGGVSAIAFVTSEPLPVIRATVDGRPGNFVIDTGGTLMLDDAFAKGLGLQLHDAGQGTFAGGKRAAIKGTKVDSITLGGATARNLDAVVLPSRTGAMFAMKIDGIVGTTVFERFLSTIDYPHNRLVLRPRGTASSQRAIEQARSSGAVVERFWLIGDHFMFARASVNDVQGLFNFDTGLAGGGLSPTPALVESAHLQLEQSAAGTGMGGGGAVIAIPFVAKTIAVGDAIQHDVPGLYSPEGNPLAMFPFRALGAVSNLFLRHYAFTMDFDSMNFILSQ